MMSVLPVTTSPTMTAADFVPHSHATAKSQPRLPRALRRVIAGWRRRGRHVARYLDLQQVDERLLYDIGINPLDVKAALDDRAVRSILFEPMRQQLKSDKQ
jgi:uncharacterized protein YjiS (DUF1127 family)